MEERLKALIDGVAGAGDSQYVAILRSDLEWLLSLVPGVPVQPTQKDESE